MNDEISSISGGEEIRKGAWSSEEDSILIDYIATHGEGRWSSLARDSGLNRTGKSCRMRWKNYLRPNIRRGNITLQEQLRILELHCIYGNRWSKIAEFLPGRTDNEIKNYWRTRVHRQAKQLKYDMNSIEFRELVRDVLVPRLYEQVRLEASKNNNLDNGPEVVQIIDCAGSHEPELDGVPHDVAMDLPEVDFGQNLYHSPCVDYGFKGDDGLANEFSYSELWDVKLNDNYFWVCP